MSYSRIVATILLMLTTTHPVFGGGDSWEFLVSEVLDPSSTTPLVTLQLVDQRKDFPVDCRILHIQITRPTWWQFWRKAPVTNDEQIKAIQALISAGKEGRPIRFGLMGAGINPIDDDRPCEFESRGLELLEENSGRMAVYSYHKWP